MTLVARKCFQCSAAKPKKAARQPPGASTGRSAIQPLKISGLVFGLEASSGGHAVGAPLGVHDLMESALGAGLEAPGRFIEHVDRLVTPTGLFAGSFRSHPTNRGRPVSCENNNYMT